MNMKTYRLIGLLPIFIIATACSLEVGSKAWCNQMDEKSKGDWTANEAGDYAKHCIFRSDD
ncbi:Uncharacterised protein [BD1-7 clade bacterium]|uniref:DUF3012 domain-containing protein n=1 Tax=BD1-7 clade bacterium TaxID=2029982 RepID=A0A5S9R1I5_9GAMM|nr:Uncharacterised protein [BD1-7 clade bacterium]